MGDPVLYPTDLMLDAFYRGKRACRIFYDPKGNNGAGPKPPQGVPDPKTAGKMDWLIDWTMGWDSYAHDADKPPYDL